MLTMTARALLHEAHRREIDRDQSSHLPFLSHPREVARLIEQAAVSAGP